MHNGSSNIRIPVDVTVRAGGLATRDGKPAPAQAFRRVRLHDLKEGDLLLNPGTNRLHHVLAVDDKNVTIKLGAGSLTVGWNDVIAATWQVVEA